MRDYRVGLTRDRLLAFLLHDDKCSPNPTLATIIPTLSAKLTVISQNTNSDKSSLDTSKLKNR